MLALSFHAQMIYAQSRSNLSQPSAPQIGLRSFPCAGDSVYEQNFNTLTVGAVPQDWTILDVDGLAPNPDIATFNGAPWIQKGWQSILSFKDSSNVSMATPSWYASIDTSDDWLITPKIKLGSNTCLSWYAYSQDFYYPEKYEVRISTTTPTKDAFLIDSTHLLKTVATEGYFENYRSVNLKNYANQDVYVAFRQTSVNKFILVLDNVRFGNVLNQDLAMYDIKNDAQLDTAATVKVKGSVINLGSDTLKLDSTLKVSYQIRNMANAPVTGWKTMTINKKLKIGPNDSLNIAHDSLWTTTNTIATYYLCMAFTASNLAGQPTYNDTLCKMIGVGTPITKALTLENVKMYPNPTQSQLFIEMGDERAQYPFSLSVYDILGSERISEANIRENRFALSLESLPNGIYLVRMKDKEGRSFTAKIQKQ